tara:strand:- start:304 stop:1260 length:957 start_codon:yes stop_codon:yes gene_type:complete
MKVARRTKDDLFKRPILTLEQADLVKPSEPLPRPIFPLTDAIQRDMGFIFNRMMDASKLQQMNIHAAEKNKQNIREVATMAGVPVATATGASFGGGPHPALPAIEEEGEKGKKLQEAEEDREMDKKLKKEEGPKKYNLDLGAPKRTQEEQIAHEGALLQQEEENLRKAILESRAMKDADIFGDSTGDTGAASSSGPAPISISTESPTRSQSLPPVPKKVGEIEEKVARGGRRVPERPKGPPPEKRRSPPKSGRQQTLQSMADREKVSDVADALNMPGPARSSMQESVTADAPKPSFPKATRSRSRPFQTASIAKEKII